MRSSFLVATLRLRHSWTSWRQNLLMGRLKRQAQRAERRLTLLQQLHSQQHLRLLQLGEELLLLEAELHPPLSLVTPPLSERVAQPYPEAQPLLHPKDFQELQERTRTSPEDLLPPPPAEETLARLLGPPPRLRSLPSSES